MIKDKIYVFHEPHITGGHAIIEVTESQIMQYMKSLDKLKDKGLTDEQYLDYFLVNNWCHEKYNHVVHLELHEHGAGDNTHPMYLCTKKISLPVPWNKNISITLDPDVFLIRYQLDYNYNKQMYVISMDRSFGRWRDHKEAVRQVDEYMNKLKAYDWEISKIE